MEEGGEEFTKVATIHLPSAHHNVHHVIQHIKNGIVNVPPQTLSHRAFFTAFHGTLTMAFSGWPQGIQVMKTALNDSPLLMVENPGTKWPKVTIGVLDDGVVLDEEQAKRLLAVIHHFNDDEERGVGGEEVLNDMHLVLYNVCFLFFLFPFKFSSFSIKEKDFRKSYCNTFIPISGDLFSPS